ncbi:MAG TPA: sugar phosphate isomerase/epimerase family protein [Rectinemataceae bacterium]|nr:sugar phosphate isomerase/epimerase family protein [Rectinemataceae bacterium]
MKIGVNTWVWVSPFTTERIELLDKVAGLGFDLVEIAVDDPAAIDAGVLKRRLADTGLGVSLCGAFGPTRDISNMDGDIRKTGREYIESCIELAGKIGCGLFSGPLYSAVGKTRMVSAEQRKRERDFCVQNMRSMEGLARSCGVTLGVEPLNRFESDMINLVEQASALIDEAGSPVYKVHIDSFHANIEEKSIPAAIRSLGKGRLCHFHGCENDRGTPGTGHQDWIGIRDALREVEYAGAVVIESFTPGAVEIAKAASIWRSLAPSQDELAEGGLKFFRRLFA